MTPQKLNQYRRLEWRIIATDLRNIININLFTTLKWYKIYILITAKRDFYTFLSKYLKYTTGKEV